MIMSIKKLAIAAIIATTSFAAHSEQLNGVSAETWFLAQDSVKQLVACKTVKSCREAGLAAAKIQARVADEYAAHSAKKAWYEGAVSAVKAMKKSGAIDGLQESQALMSLVSLALENGVSIDISKE